MCRSCPHRCHFALGAFSSLPCGCTLPSLLSPPGLLMCGLCSSLSPKAPRSAPFVWLCLLSNAAVARVLTLHLLLSTRVLLACPALVHPQQQREQRCCTAQSAHHTDPCVLSCSSCCVVMTSCSAVVHPQRHRDQRRVPRPAVAHAGAQPRRAHHHGRDPQAPLVHRKPARGGAQADRCISVLQRLSAVPWLVALIAVIAESATGTPGS